jgi:hypothetical protein
MVCGREAWEVMPVILKEIQAKRYPLAWIQEK